jgi:predicted amidohydrolase YtcJ
VPDLVITRADLGDGRSADIRVAAGRIAAVGTDLAIGRSDRILDAAGGAVIPGLHDHHVHLSAMAAARRSLGLGGGAVSGPERLEAALREADRGLPEGAWLRGVGYHDGLAGPLGRGRLDSIVPDRPVKIQHRSGHEWTVNTRALEAVQKLAPEHAGIERDDSGSPTGRLHGMDRVIAEAGEGDAPCLGASSERAARLGVTGFTDATPFDDIGELEALADARSAGRLLQQTTVMTSPRAAGNGCPEELVLGPVKLMLHDTGLPGLDDLCTTIARAHHAGRPVAVHCVTRVQLVLTVTALGQTGAVAGDRIEHGSVIPCDLLDALRALGVCVVTNPGFLFGRGDDYLADVDPEDRGDLYRCRSLMAAGVAVAAGTDAPFGPDDPWLLLRTAVDRRTSSGQLVGEDEGVDQHRALSLLLGPGAAPGSPRAITPGSPGNLCVLFTPLAQSLRELDARNVAATVIAGEVVADNR